MNDDQERPDMPTPFARAAAYQSAHDSGELARVALDSLVDIEPYREGEVAPDVLP